MSGPLTLSGTSIKGMCRRSRFRWVLMERSSFGLDRSGRLEKRKEHCVKVVDKDLSAIFLLDLQRKSCKYSAVFSGFIGIMCS